MVSRQDLRDLIEAVNQLQAALDDIQELQEASENPDVTVNPAAYAGAQERLKQAVYDLWTTTDGAADTTGEFVTEDGTTVSLPNAGLSRETDGDGSLLDPTNS